MENSVFKSVFGVNLIDNAQYYVILHYLVRIDPIEILQYCKIWISKGITKVPKIEERLECLGKNESISENWRW